MTYTGTQASLCVSHEDYNLYTNQTTKKQYLLYAFFYALPTIPFLFLKRIFLTSNELISSRSVVLYSADLGVDLLIFNLNLKNC